ncbi:response regulator [Desulforhopalus sp. IMCC35007]|uniref:response regulator n=1 Tax=Desulforhopalus sp. IMCC35007 TaxID=2569543 RepID=UPI0010AE0DEF|nr:response regulator [Desulforhopalus sp. IMCC35007]TKB11206.1 response regulator [Desulforhopalus sp. IMCC35007]
MKILIIDDDSRIRNLFRLWLEREGYEVFEAENGLEGMRILRSSEIDLLICDLIMPVQEGIETITQVKHEFPDIGIIAISGGGKIGPDSYLSVAEHLGAWRIFTKPIDMRLMIETIQEWREVK